MEKLVELTNDDLRTIEGGWVARGVIVWVITEVIDGVIDGLQRPCN